MSADAEAQRILDEPERLVQEHVAAINALVEKLAKAEAKVEQYQITIGQHIKAIKAARPDDWLEIVRDQCKLGRSRAYELLLIADGTKTVEEVRADSAERKAKERKRTSESVTSRTPRSVTATAATVDAKSADYQDMLYRNACDILQSMTAETRKRFFAWIEKQCRLHCDTAPKLNALGKPLNPKHDPDYEMRHRTPKLKGKPGAKRLTPDQWDAMSAEARAEWKRWADEEAAAVECDKQECIALNEKVIAAERERERWAASQARQ